MLSLPARSRRIGLDVPGQRVARMGGCRKGPVCFVAPDLAVMPHKYNADLATIFRGRSDA